MKDHSWRYEQHFSMDAATLDRINDKLSLCNDAGIDGDQIRRFRALKIIYNNTMFKFIGKEESKEDCKKIQQQIDKINNLIRERPLNANKGEMAQYLVLQGINIEKLLDTLEMDLNKLLFKYNIINLKIAKREYAPKEKWE